MQVSFTIEFLGGLGEAKIKVKDASNVDKVLVYTTSKSCELTLPDGVYRITITGASAPEGTNVTISSPTVPATPDNLPKGVILKSYSLTLNSAQPNV